MSACKWSSATANRQMLSMKTDFALGMSNFLSCWEIKGTPVAVAMSSQLTVACPVEKGSPSHSTTEMAKALGREDVSLKHLHVGR